VPDGKLLFFFLKRKVTKRKQVNETRLIRRAAVVFNNKEYCKPKIIRVFVA